MDHDDHVVGVLERACVSIKRSLVEAPVRRVADPQRSGDLAPVGCQSCASALGLEIVLVPETSFDRGSKWQCRFRDVLAKVPVNRDQPRASFRAESSSDACGTAVEHNLIDETMRGSRRQSFR